MQPDRIKVGAGVVLVSVDGVARDWGIPEESIRSLLNTFEIPRIRFPGQEKRYVSLWSLERALFEAGLPLALKGSRSLVTALHEAAGLMYQTASKEVIHERLKALAKDLRKPGPHTNVDHRKNRPTGTRKKKR